MTELSPLQEIERRVQARAKEISLEMTTDLGKGKLRALIDDEMRAWSADYQRGMRAYDLADPDVVAERAFRNLAGYGPLEPLLADDDVWEIAVADFRDLRFSRKTRSAGMRSCPLLCVSAP